MSSRLGFRFCLLGLLLPFISQAARAHVGNKDVYEDVSAGPYKLFVTLRTPVVIPGTVVVEVRSAGAPLRALTVSASPLTGKGSQFLPEPETLTASSADPSFYAGSTWIMAQGSWRLRFHMEGPAGVQVASVPLAAAPLSVTAMSPGMGYGLGALGFLLVFGAVAIAAAAARESELPPGVAARGKALAARAAIAGSAAFLVIAGLIAVGNRWWNVSAAHSLRGVYQPIRMTASLHANELSLQLSSASAEERPASDFISDHGHLMHLYAVREPGLDTVFHLHPEQVGVGKFQLALPSMPPGRYTLYSDLVHASGFPETAVAGLSVPPNLPGRPLDGDDAEGTAAPIGSAAASARFTLPDGAVMIWDRPPVLRAGSGYQFRFHLLGPDGQPARDMGLYMGMIGHAAFLKDDGTVFAHVHPEGSASMAAMMLANETGPLPGTTAMAMDTPSSTVAFPYGFPKAGNYRIFVQMKRGSTVETGIFDAVVQ